MPEIAPKPEAPPTAFLLDCVRRLDAVYLVRRGEGELELIAREWARSFEGFPLEAIEWAVCDWIDGDHEFAPRVGQLRMRIMMRVLEYPDPDAALRMVHYCVTLIRGGRANTADDLRDLIDCQPLYQAVRAVGLEAIVEADTPPAKAAWRKQLLDAYALAVRRCYAERSRPSSAFPVALGTLSATKLNRSPAGDHAHADTGHTADDDGSGCCTPGGRQATS